jgi:hypothetical protein
MLLNVGVGTDLAYSGGPAAGAFFGFAFGVACANAGAADVSMKMQNASAVAVRTINRRKSAGQSRPM